MSERSDPVPAPSPARARWWPSLALAAVLAVVVLGGYVTTAALSRPAGPPIDVAGVLRVRPLSGWQLATRFGSPPGARLSRGSGNLDLAALSFGGTPIELARAYVDQVLDPGSDHLSVSERVEPVRLDSGLAGVRFSYVGTFGRAQVAIEGEVTAVVSDQGVGAVFDAWSPEGLLQYVLDDTETMIDRAKVG